MKTYITLLLVVMPFLTGCNSEIFIDRLITEIPDTCIVEDNKSYRVNFDSEDWDILNIYNMEYFSLKIYDLDGNFKKDYLPLENNETAIIHCESTYYKFRIEKRDRRSMDIICEKNLNNSFEDFKIEVGNKYIRKTIDVSLKPTRKFVLDKVEYDFSKDFYYSEDIIEQVDGMNVYNSGNETITLSFYPFKDSKRRIEFHPDDNAKFNNIDKYLGYDLPQITIPDIVNGKPVLNNTKVTFGLKEQSFRTGRVDKDLIIYINVKPKEKKNCMIYNCIEEYHVNYKVHVSNPDTGEKLIFTGRMSSADPFDYIYIPQNQK